MLSYNHIYHAGNHADVFKHITLLILLLHLNEKEKPYTVIESHAGSGKYNLCDERSLKTNDADTGIKKLLNKIDVIKQQNEYLEKYFKIIEEYTSKNFYPGSPLLEEKLLRSFDKLILCELNKKEYSLLKTNVKNAQVHNIDGFTSFSSLVPPKITSSSKINKHTTEQRSNEPTKQISRGLFFSDPSYEEKDEYEKLITSFKKLNEKWKMGIFALWYPLLSYKSDKINSMKKKIIEIAKSSDSDCNILDAMLCVNSEDSHKEMPLEKLQSKIENPPRLYGSGMLIVNSPWKLDEKLRAVLPILKENLQVDKNGSWKIELH
ncbi:MAG: 23S rRNA (adenine(2030)-N(6))-methyltransferase RlmJ [Treponema sp.]|nr:23S rRNA (adenine(2030)-N(6))-methyltransferase RlmJ [Treponema sp.]